jgi:hypothetical protein
MENAINAAPFVDGYCIGNEGLSAGRYTRAELEEAMDELRGATGKPVTTTEPSGEYQGDLMDFGDWIFPNVHPYWHGFTDPLAAVDWTIAEYENFTGRTDKVVFFKEVGLPSNGDANMNEENQNTYYKEMSKWNVDNESMAFAYFEAFDQPWKDWAGVEPYWGIFDQDRNEKLVATPQIVHVYCPPRFSHDNLIGMVLNVDPGTVKSSTYIKVRGTWWMKPYWNNPLSTIGADCVYVTDITTGGVDSEATMVNSYMVHPSFSPVVHTLPDLADPLVYTWTSTSR